MILIQELDEERLDKFFQYLSIHVSENGINGTVPFLPLSVQQSILSDELMAKFKEGMKKNPGELGWRKIWVAVKDLQIVGHIDIRTHNQLNSEHRVILGMGVDTNFRKSNIGTTLLEVIIEYCKRSNGICWIDLEVMSINSAAKKLYEKVGFKKLSETKDMFRIENISYDYTAMTLEVKN